MVDAHCHLYDLETLEDIDQLNLIICNGAGIETNDKTWEIAQKYENVYATAGCHPEEMENIMKMQMQQRRSSVMIPPGTFFFSYSIHYQLNIQNYHEELQGINILKYSNYPTLMRSIQELIRS